MTGKKDEILHIRCSKETKLQLAELARLSKRTSADCLRLLVETAYENVTNKQKCIDNVNTF